MADRLSRSGVRLALSGLALGVAGFALGLEAGRRAGAGAGGAAGPEPRRDAAGATTTPAPAPAWLALAKGIGKGFFDDRLMAEAASVTFYTLLAVFPALAALVSIYGLVADPMAVDRQIEQLSAILPGGALSILRERIGALSANGATGLGLRAAFSLLTSLWSANQGMKSLFDAMNAVYRRSERRGFVRYNAMAMLFTVGGLTFVILAMACLAVVPVALGLVGFEGRAAFAVAWGRWPFLVASLAGLLALIYRFGPDRGRARWRWIACGSLAATSAWLCASTGFSYYARNFGSFDRTYGSLGAAVGFMTWIWISVLIVLLGAELDARLERRGLPAGAGAGRKA